MTALLHRVAVGRRFGELATAGDAFFVTGSVGINRLPFVVNDGVEKGFSGTNSLVLLQVMKDQSWSDARFFTAQQIDAAGWKVLPNAKRIGLQFLVATDDQGTSLEAPSAIVFHVFNASDIVGLPKLSRPVKPLRADIETASVRAGFGLNEGLAAGVGRWLDSIQNHALESTEPVAVELRTRLTMSLLEIQFGVPLINSLSSSLTDSCLLSIRENPLSFSHAANDSRKLESLVMSQVNLVRVEREALESLDQFRSGQDAPVVPVVPVMSGSIKVPKSFAVELEAMFGRRVAVLNVPFTQKDEAKALGAMWFAPESVWFVPEGRDVAPFAKWEPSAVRLSVEASRESVIEAFREVMLDHGLDASADILDDGKWHNVAVEKNNSMVGNKSGSYIFSMDGGRYGQPIGTVLNKYTGESFTWTTHKSGSLTPQQRVQCKAESDARDAAAALVVQGVQNTAAVHASEIWTLGGAAAEHGYVVKKGISDQGLRQVSGLTLLKYAEFKSESGGSVIDEKENYLLVPMTNSAGELRAVQAISGDGSLKLFMRGAQKKGTMFVMGSPSFAEVAKSHTPFVSFVEGVATGSSFYSATEKPVVVCFDAGNLETVFGENVAQLGQGIVPVLAVDNDQFFVEKGLGFLAEKLGVNPHAGGASVTVRSGPFEVRSVALGEAIADGAWHQAAKGSYCISVERDDVEDFVRSLRIDLVPEAGRKSSATFLNRGLEAGFAGLKKMEAGRLDAQAVIVAPVFKNLSGRPTDWNDLAQIDGLEAVRAVLRQQGLQVASHVAELPVKKKMLAMSR